jgi:hypothetical protein
MKGSEETLMCCANCIKHIIKCDNQEGSGLCKQWESDHMTFQMRLALGRDAAKGEK